MTTIGATMAPTFDPPSSLLPPVSPLLMPIIGVAVDDILINCVVDVICIVTAMEPVASIVDIVKFAVSTVVINTEGEDVSDVEDTIIAEDPIDDVDVVVVFRNSGYKSNEMIKHNFAYIFIVVKLNQ